MTHDSESGTIINGRSGKRYLIQLTNLGGIGDDVQLRLFAIEISSENNNPDAAGVSYGTRMNQRWGDIKRVLVQRELVLPDAVQEIDDALSNGADGKFNLSCTLADLVRLTLYPIVSSSQEVRITNKQVD